MQTDATTPNIVAPTMLGVVACMLAVVCANGCNNSQQCWDLQCIVGRIQPMSLCKACVRSVRGPNNVGRVVQTNPTLLCYVSAITEEKKCWESCTATEVIPTIEMIPATEMIPNHHRNDPQSPPK